MFMSGGFGFKTSFFLSVSTAVIFFVFVLQSTVSQRGCDNAPPVSVKILELINEPRTNIFDPLEVR